MGRLRTLFAIVVIFLLQCIGTEGRPLDYSSRLAAAQSSEEMTLSPNVETIKTVVTQTNTTMEDIKRKIKRSSPRDPKTGGYKSNENCARDKVTISEATEDSLNVTWDRRACDDVSGVHINKAETEVLDGSKCRHEGKSVDANPGANELNIRGLCPGQEYIILILDRREKPFQVVIGETQPEKPAAVTDLRVTKNEGSGYLKYIELKWTNPNRLKYKFKNFLLYKTKSEAHFEEFPVYPNDASEIIMPYLVPWTEYIFKVKSCITRQGHKGICSESDALKAKTTKKNPSGACMAFEAANIGATDVRVKWTAPARWLRYGPIDGYSIEYKAEVDRGWKSIELTSEEHRCKEKTIFGMTPYTQYQFRIRAYNVITGLKKYGPEKETTFKTNPAAPSKPLSIEVTELGSRKITVSWKEPAVKNGQIAGYRVTLKCIRQITHVEATGSARLSIEIEGLLPDTEYDVSVLAYNIFEKSALFSVESEAQVITTLTEEKQEAPFSWPLFGFISVLVLLFMFIFLACTCTKHQRKIITAWVFKLQLRALEMNGENNGKLKKKVSQEDKGVTITRNGRNKSGPAEISHVGERQLSSPSPESENEANSTKFSKYYTKPIQGVSSKTIHC